MSLLIYETKADSGCETGVYCRRLSRKAGLKVNNKVNNNEKSFLQSEIFQGSIRKRDGARLSGEQLDERVLH
jgi:hypothetical protein